MNSVLDVRKYSRLVVCGDIHGDYTAFLRILREAGLCTVPDSMLSQAQLCMLSRKAMKQTLHWLDPEAGLILLGDVVDGVRRGSTWMCGHSGHMHGVVDHHDNSYANPLEAQQQLIFDTIEHLQKSHGARIHVLLGNHDVGNLVGNPGFCAFANGVCDAAGSFLNTSTYSHAGAYQALYRKIRACHLCMVVHNGTRRNGILLCHGGFNDLENDARALGLTNGGFLVWRRNLNVINRVGRDLVMGTGAEREAAIARYAETEFKQPTWGRPGSFEGMQVDALQKYFGCRTMIKAHDGKATVHCVGQATTGSAQTTSGVVVPFGQKRLCFADRYMSQAFGPLGTRVYGYFEITKEGIRPFNFK